MQFGMILIWLGALLIICGVLLGLYQTLRKGRLSEARRTEPSGSGATLEPRGPVRAFSPRTHWPAVTLVALGILLMLTRAVTG